MNRNPEIIITNKSDFVLLEEVHGIKLLMEAVEDNLFDLDDFLANQIEKYFLMVFTGISYKRAIIGEDSEKWVK